MGEARKVNRAKEQAAALRMLTFAYEQAGDGWERLAEIDPDEQQAAAMRRKSTAARQQAAALRLARDRAVERRRASQRLP